MRALLAIPLLALVAACSQQPPQQVAEMRTIENTPLRTVPTATDPMLDDFVPEVPLPLEPVVPEDETEDGDETTTNPDADPEVKTREPVSIRLPFAPPIAMDPVDGQKVSITAQTPTVEYKGRIYYFTDTTNRAMFVKSPQQYLTGTFAAY